MRSDHSFAFVAGRVAVGLFSLFSLLCPLSGQEFRAVLKGHVVDPSGSAVPQAKASVRHVETNQAKDAVSDGQGDFTIPFLQPGTYEVSVTASGFKTYRRTDLTLMVGQTAALEIRLDVGDLTETVRVTSEAPLLDAVKADRGMVIDNQRVTEMPLNGRNPVMISSMLPGVNFNSAVIYFRPFDNGAINQWSINGSGGAKTEYLLDGAPNNAQAGANNIAAVPGVDAVAEFKIQTNSYDAQYGHTGGGVMNISLKSGSNTLHGTVYEFARRAGWDANTFQNNAANPVVPRPLHILDQYGFEVDGPVFLPKLYDGRNRTFFMFNLERYQEENPVTILNSFPELDMRGGDFSKLRNSQGAQIAIFDPTTGNAANNYTRTPFAGNIIPPSRINPIASKILSYFPKPNAVTPGQNYSSLNYQVPASDANQHERYKTYTTKIDQNIGNQRFFVRHIYTNRDLLRSVNGIHTEAGNDGYFPFLRNNTGAVADWVSMVNPTNVFNLRLSFNRYIEGSGVGKNEGFDITTLGFPAALAAALPNGKWFQVYAFSGYSTLGATSYYGYTNNFAVHPNITRIQGAHSLKAGFDMRWIQYNDQTTGQPMNMTSNAGFTQRNWQQADALSGNSIATFLLGTPSSVSSAWNVKPSYLYRYFAPYLQDDWKISRRLTLNLGLRWDFNLPPKERYNRMNRGFDQNVVNSVDTLVTNRSLLSGPVRGSLLFAGIGGTPQLAANLYKKAIQPRAGAAYQLNDKTVLRGGWGRYYVNPSNDYFQTNGFSQTTSFDTSLDGGRTPIPNVMNNPAPNGIPAPPGSSLGDRTYLGRGFNFVNPDFRLPYIDHFSVGVQRQLPFNSKIEVSYVGSRGREVQSTKPINNYSAALRDSCNPLSGGKVTNCSDLVANPFYNLAPFAGTSLFSNATIAKSTLAQTFPAYGGLTEVARNDGKTWYNSLQIAYEVRARKGLNLIVAYTLSKQIDQAGWNDVYTNTMQRGLIQFDRTHLLTTTAVYELPFGPGKRVLGNSGRALGRIVGGWELNWMVTYSSGKPWALPNGLYLRESKNPSIDWNQARVWGVQTSTKGGVTAACVARMNNDGSITMQPFSVNAGCTDYAFLGTPTYAPRYIPSYDGRLRGMSQQNVDMSLNKTTKIAERARIQFRAEAFNLLNHYYVDRQGFVNDLNSALFGSLDKATVGTLNTNAPRQVQLGVKFIW
jgi:hypothetical protein